MKNPELLNIKEVSNKDLVFEARQHKEGVKVYIFHNLNIFIAIDTTGKNYKELPELLFGVYNRGLDIGSLNQPQNKNNINMEQVSECIKEISRISGLNQFFFYPFGDDVDVENKDNRELARLRLFKRLSPNINPASSGHGYILTI